MTSNDEYVIELLARRELLAAAPLGAAREAAVKAGMTPLDIMIQDGVIDEDLVLEIIAEEFNMQVVGLKGVEIPADIRGRISADIARRYHVVPVSQNDIGLTVAMSDPLDFDSLDTLRHILNCHVEGAVAKPSEVKAALDRYYPVDTDVESMINQMVDETVDVSVTGLDSLGNDADVTESDAPIIKLVHLIILEAYRNRASDIHLEPMERRFRVRFRIDGVLHEVESPPKRLQAAMISRVKIMAGMKISERRVPQDGRIQVNISGRELDLRVSTVPANYGEGVVMRILDKQNLALGMAKLGFFADDQQTFDRLIGLSDGILLVTGPTGSGKTTTLYACLQAINRPDRKIITVEDPVEYQMSGINQVQVRPDINLTFSTALRSILRQAPNIIMIGEIRDVETARIATEASLTGHLVFSTLHTNDAPGAITRLLDIGIKPFLVASSVRAVMAQRLVRLLCEHCKEPTAVTEVELKLLGAEAHRVRDVVLLKGRGCQHCSMTGYRGRCGIFEIFVINEEIQRMIYDSASSFELRKRARELGMRTLREDGMRKVLAGTTTLEEVFRVTMGDAD